MKVTSKWPTVPLDDVVEESQYGTSLKANEHGSGVPVLRMNNITYSGALDLTDMKHVEMPKDDFEQYSVRRGDLLFNRTNSQELVGKMACWNRDEQIAFAGYLVRLRLRRDRADPAFIAAWFNTPEMKTLLRARAKPSINMANINAAEVLKFPVVLPPLSEQRRIAEVLDRAEALRAKRHAALAQLDSLTQSLFLDLFGDPTDNPKGWLTKPLDELCRGITDIDHKMPVAVENGVPFISAKDLTNDGRISFESVKRISEEDFRRLSRKSKPEKGDIIYSRIGVNLGKARMVEVDFDFVASYSCCTIKPNRELVDAFYLCCLLDSPFILRQAHKGVRAIGVPDLGMGEIKAFKIIVPPIQLQREFAQRVTAVEALKTAQRASLAELDALFATLQHRAFKGEL